jgi:hypothetical protein
MKNVSSPCLQKAAPYLEETNEMEWTLWYVAELLLLQLLLEQAVVVLLLGTSFHMGQSRLLLTFISIISSWNAVYQVLTVPLNVQQQLVIYV